MKLFKKNRIKFNKHKLYFRIFLGLCENEKYRGPIVAAGGAKVCKTNVSYKIINKDNYILSYECISRTSDKIQ